MPASLVCHSSIINSTIVDISTSKPVEMGNEYHKSPHPTSPSPSRFHSIKAMRPDKTTLPRFWRNLKFFFLDSWFDVLCILVVAGIAGAVSVHSIGGGGEMCLFRGCQSSNSSIRFGSWKLARHASSLFSPQMVLLTHRTSPIHTRRIPSLH